MAGRSLHGCLITAPGNEILIRREPAGCDGPVPFGEVWDGRWMVTGPGETGLHIAALGENGLAQRPDWRVAGAARRVLLTTPAVWSGEQLVAAPLLEDGAAWQAKICLRNDFFTR